MKWLKSQENLNSYLMLLSDKQYNIIIDIYNPDIWKDSVYVHLFENLGVSMDKITDTTDCLVIKEGGADVDVLNGFHSSEGVSETSIGRLGLLIDEMDDAGTVTAFGIYLDDEKRYTASLAEQAGMRILVLDKDSMETYDSAAFSYIVEKQKKYHLTTTAVNR